MFVTAQVMIYDQQAEQLLRKCKFVTRRFIPFVQWLVHAGSGPSSSRGQPAGHGPRFSLDLNEPLITTAAAVWAHVISGIFCSDA
jgi:hypothetical protein